MGNDTKTQMYKAQRTRKMKKKNKTLHTEEHT